jgi:hypothetical protein
VLTGARKLVHDDIEKAVAARMDRQRVLTHPHPLA